MKAAIAGVAALLVGLGAGLWFGMARVNALRTELDTAQNDGEALRNHLQTVEGHLAIREAELARVRDELEQARSRQAAAPQPAAPEPEPTDFDSSELFAQLAQALGETDEPGRRERRFGDRFESTGRPPEDGGEPREDRRRGYMDEFRQRMSDFLTAEIEASTDPAEKARIASISEYMQSLMEQRQLLRDAQTDEERQAVFDTMRQNGETLRSMVEEQQDQVLRESLERQGISSRAQQDGIIAAYKEAQNDPFFTGPFTFFGGGRRGRGGPPGGGPPGGGPP